MLKLTAVSPVFPVGHLDRRCLGKFLTQQRPFLTSHYLRLRYHPLFAESPDKEEQTTDNLDAVIGEVQDVSEVEVKTEPQSLQPPPRTPLSESMKARMRQEYIGLGGAENKAMGTNWFLVISVVIAVLAILAKLTGSI